MPNFKTPKIINIIAIAIFTLFPINGIINAAEDNPLGVIEGPPGVPTEPSSLIAIINLAIKGLIGVGFLLAFIYLLIAGINFITSSGEPTKVAAARKKIIFSIVGIIVIGLSFAIVSFVETVFNIPATSPELPF